MIAYSLVLTAFTVYSVLDTFVIARSYEMLEDGDVTHTEATNAQITETSYKDENISIEIRQYREFDTDIYVADITLSSPEYLKTALANDAYGRNIRELPSSMSARKNAILTVNGDFYGAREQGYVLRNGRLLRSTPTEGLEDLVIYKDGSFGIINESERSAEDLLKEGAQQIFFFGPALIKNGAVSVDTSSKVDKEFTSNPRTAIGIIDELHYVFVVSDGRWEESRGLSLHQLALFMEGLGVQTAYNLDGGGSSTMYFNGRIVNRPTEDGKELLERTVSDVVYIGY